MKPTKAGFFLLVWWNSMALKNVRGTMDLTVLSVSKHAITYTKSNYEMSQQIAQFVSYDLRTNNHTLTHLFDFDYTNLNNLYFANFFKNERIIKTRLMSNDGSNIDNESDDDLIAGIHVYNMKTETMIGVVRSKDHRLLSFKYNNVTKCGHYSIFNIDNGKIDRIILSDCSYHPKSRFVAFFDKQKRKRLVKIPKKKRVLCEIETWK